MDWNSKILRTSSPFVSHSFTNFLCNSHFDPFSGLEIKQDGQVEIMAPIINPQIMEPSYGTQERRIRRLTGDQLESLEASFQAERKLEPSRKMKLAKELGLQPRQVAVWFQNRRARWKAKKIEHLYDDLKQEFAIVSKEKLKLQEEVVRLKTVVKELTNRKNVASIGSREASGEELVERRMVGVGRCKKHGDGSEVGTPNFDQFYQANFLFDVNDFALVQTPCWGTYS